MYALYSKVRIGGGFRYEYAEDACFFGCNSGYLHWLLQKQTPTKQNEPYAWHIDFQKALNNNGYPSMTFVIDIKPKQSKKYVFLCELLDVWGFSEHGWSPMLLLLDGLVTDEDPAVIEKNRFNIEKAHEPFDPIYEFIYTLGSVEDGILTDKWLAPPVSATNAALLWPKQLNYFLECMRKRTPNVLSPTTE
ncbi:MAG TPA: hypothetical protein VF398_07020 [bacterium]|jgi:hypothetical protein